MTQLPPQCSQLSPQPPVPSSGPAPVKRKKGLAIVGLVFGIVSILMSIVSLALAVGSVVAAFKGGHAAFAWLILVGYGLLVLVGLNGLLALLGIMFSAVALARKAVKGIAVTGLVLSILGLLLAGGQAATILAIRSWGMSNAAKASMKAAQPDSEPTSQPME